MSGSEIKSIKTRKDLRALANESGYICRKGRKRPSIRILDDGTILRADVRLDHALPMTVKDAAEVLGFKS